MVHASNSKISPLLQSRSQMWRSGLWENCSGLRSAVNMWPSDPHKYQRIHWSVDSFDYNPAPNETVVDGRIFCSDHLNSPINTLLRSSELIRWTVYQQQKYLINAEYKRVITWFSVYFKWNSCKKQNIFGSKQWYNAYKEFEKEEKNRYKNIKNKNRI